MMLQNNFYIGSFVTLVNLTKMLDGLLTLNCQFSTGIKS